MWSSDNYPVKGYCAQRVTVMIAATMVTCTVTIIEVWSMKICRSMRNPCSAQCFSSTGLLNQDPLYTEHLQSRIELYLFTVVSW